MDKYRPKRPTSLNLFPQLPQAGSQDSINNNSLGKKDSWKDSHSSSPHITGDPAPQDAQPKAEDKVRPAAQRRPAPKPPTASGSNGRTNGQTAASAADARVRPRERQPPAATQPCSTPRSQRRAGGGGGGRGGGGGGGRGGGRGAMREKNQGELRGTGTDRRGGRLCEDKAKDKDKNGHQRQRDGNGPRGRAAEGRGRGGTKVSSRGGVGIKSNNKLTNQEVYLPAMVVPRTPVTARSQEKSQNQGQNHDRTQENPPAALSRSSSEGGSNRMSLSSDTEGPPPGPLQPPLSCRTNPDIREEDGEGEPTPCASVQKHHSCSMAGTDKPEAGPGGDKVGVEMDRNQAKSEAAAGLNYDSVKYTLVVDEHAQLELGKLKDCLHGHSEHNEDSDTETVYQSANEEEDPEYEEERRKSEEARKLERRKEEEKQRKEEEKRRKEEEEAKRRKEEDLKRRREEEVKRRREVVAVARVCKQSKVSSATTSEEEESNGGRGPRSRKFLNLFSASSSSPYCSTGAGSFGLFSCLLDGVERQQSHRAVYRFVPRHADELQLETDDPVLMLKQSEDLWCQGYNMRTGATGIFPAFYAVRVSKDGSHARNDGWTEPFVVRFLGSVQVPFHMGNDVLCSAMQKVACNRRSAGQPPSACVLEVSVKGVKMIVQDQCHSAHRGDQCFHFFQLKNISFCGCHPKHSRYFGFITKHPDQQRFACHVLMSDTSLHPLAESVRRAFQQYYKEHIGYSCPTEDIFIE
ncbi:C-Jun-amino-terminal kinase-interacting protein 1-like [Cyprinodon tularosa]|uniref:C-Jun-amino-terminal kinase-interacting protein 1-like n=1 Tax=Cyprinodon tularosa TaxID=77115 RepID=UPI0018E27768|nr:C-Jun-amino-terminal kinase-interacting protein 1-like [Cyprinodon tularosa]